jgi:hypothetical protein
VFDHLRRITGEHGLFEHALRDEPRLSHGYTTDDNARALVVAARAGEGALRPLDVEPYLGFVLAGEVAGGWHNRMTESGEWSDLRGPDDTHGRAIWGLGEMVAAGWVTESIRDALMAGILAFDSTYPRAVAYAVFGSVAALESGVLVELNQEFLADASRRLPRPKEGPWTWPEARLTYDNARLPEALIRAGSARVDPVMTEDGMRMLSWLIKCETHDRHFSFTPVAGRGEGEHGPAFDQQPLEAWAMADACYAALRVDPHRGWHDALVRANDWFLGENDTGVALYDEETGAGFDGLERDGVNDNRGAESTLAALGTLLRRHQVDSWEGVV